MSRFTIDVGVLGVVLVGLKLCHIIDWSWWWITLPFWAIPTLLVIAMVLTVAITLVIFLAAALMS